MARLPTTVRVLRSDAEGLNIQNTFNQAIYDAMAGQLTFTENIRCQIKEITFTTSPDYSTNEWANISFPITLKTKAAGVFLMQIYAVGAQTPIYDPVSIQWQDINGNLVINWIAGLEDETQYFIRLMVI